MSRSQEDIENDLIGNILLDDPKDILKIRPATIIRKSAPFDFHKSCSSSEEWKLQPHSNFVSSKDSHRSSYYSFRSLHSAPTKQSLKDFNITDKTAAITLDHRTSDEDLSSCLDQSLVLMSTRLPNFDNHKQNQENALKRIDNNNECQNEDETNEQKQKFYSPHEKKVRLSLKSSYFSAPIKPKTLEVTPQLFETKYTHKMSPSHQKNSSYVMNHNQNPHWSNYTNTSSQTYSNMQGWINAGYYGSSNLKPSQSVARYSSRNSKFYDKQNPHYFLSNLLESCKDQYGSRLIQQYLEKAAQEEREKLFHDILPFLYRLMTDVFGNYIVQKILEIGTIQQKLEIYKIIREHIFELSCHTYGCRVIQKTLEEFKNNECIQDEILQSLKADIFFLIEDPNSNHVIQKCFETVPCEKLSFIVEVVVNRIDRLCMNGYGCRVIQRMLENCAVEQTIPMLKKIMANTYQCCQCQYGNYLMQFILDKGPKEEKEILLQVLKKNFIKFSLDKFASNVTEKSITHSSSEFREEIVDILISNYYDNKIGLVALMNHPYGNYVLQRLFECSGEQIQRKIYDAIIASGCLEEIRRNIHGKHVMGFIEKLLQI